MGPQRTFQLIFFGTVFALVRNIFVSFKMPIIVHLAHELHCAVCTFPWIFFEVKFLMSNQTYFRRKWFRAEAASQFVLIRVLFQMFNQCDFLFEYTVTTFTFE